MIRSGNDLAGKFAHDVTSVDALRQSARQNSPAALKGAAQQFEALFMNMMLKSMRDATPQDGMFDSDQTRSFTTMLDQQLSQNLATRGVGLADVLVRQLSPKVREQAAAAAAPGVNPVSGPAGPAAAPSINDAGQVNPARPKHVRDFHAAVAGHAEEASRATGIPAKFLISQAALESGWGRHEIVAVDGSRSHNMFGIKATAGWNGKVVESMTTEYVNGVPQRRLEKFRAYDSYADGFSDYASMLRNNPRYQRVLANAQDASSFAQGLQRAGYATDPHYADKLSRIIRTTTV